MQTVIPRIGATSLDAWTTASLKGARGVEVGTPFSSVIGQGYTAAMQALFSREEFGKLKARLQPGGLDGQKVSIYGAGSFGLTLATILSEAEADITIYAAPEAPTAMARALGILEPQGSSVESYFRASLPIFDELIKVGAPIRRDKVVYYYKNLNSGFVRELERIPSLNHKVEATDRFGCNYKLSFDGYIMSGSSMRDFYMQMLATRGVRFVAQEIRELKPVPGHLTFSALGMGRAKVQGEQALDLPGNRGQMTVVEGTDVAELLNGFPDLVDSGSVGIPTSAGSVNIVLHYRNPSAREDPFLIIGATKDPGNGMFLPREGDSRFILEGVKELWPALYNHLQAYAQSTSSDIDPARLNWIEYVCVRPGGGTSPFAIKSVNGCVDISCAGGTGNSIAPGAALKAIFQAL